MARMRIREQCAHRPPWSPHFHSSRLMFRIANPFGRQLTTCVSWLRFQCVRPQIHIFESIHNARAGQATRFRNQESLPVNTEHAVPFGLLHHPLEYLS